MKRLLYVLAGLLLAVGASAQVFLAVQKPPAASGDSITHFNSTVSTIDTAGDLVFASPYSSALTAGGAPTGYAGYALVDGELSFNSGGTGDIDDGETIEGDTSGATATVLAVHTTGGTWAGGDVVGKLYVTSVSGTFQNGEGVCLTSCGTQRATLTSALVTTDAVKIAALMHRDDFATSDATCSNASNTTICADIGYNGTIDGGEFHWQDTYGSGGNGGSAGGQLRPNVSGTVAAGVLSAAITSGFVCVQAEFLVDPDVITNHASYVTGWAEQKMLRTGPSTGDDDVLIGFQYSGANGVWIDGGPDANIQSGIKPVGDGWIRITKEIDLASETVDVWLQRESDTSATKIGEGRTYGQDATTADVKSFFVQNNSSGHDDAVLLAHDVYIGIRHWIVWKDTTANCSDHLGEGSIG